MNPARPLLTLAGCAALIASPALAQEAASFDAPITVQQGPEGCSIGSAPGSATGVAVSVGDTPDGMLWLRASGANWRFEPGKIYRIRAYAVSETNRADGPGTEARGFRDAAGWGGIAIRGDVRLLQSAQRIVLYDGSSAMPFAELSNPYPQHIYELSACRAALLRTGQRSIPGEPTPRSLVATWFSNDDYPAAAIRAQQSGVTRVRASVDQTGMVAACEIAQSSGNMLLDTTSCSLMRRRARFVPARDATGTAVKGIFTMAFHWETHGFRDSRLYATR